MNFEGNWVDIILEENSWCLTMRDFLGVMCHRVLVSVKRARAWCDVGRRNNRDEVLESGKRFLSDFKGVIQRLCDIRIVWPKGKFGDNMRQVHSLVLSVLVTMTTVSMSKGSDVEVSC